VRFGRVRIIRVLCFFFQISAIFINKGVLKDPMDKRNLGYIGFLGLLGLLAIPTGNYGLMGLFGFFGFFSCFSLKR